MFLPCRVCSQTPGMEESPVQSQPLAEPLWMLLALPGRVVFSSGSAVLAASSSISMPLSHRPWTLRTSLLFHLQHLCYTGSQQGGAGTAQPAELDVLQSQAQRERLCWSWARHGWCSVPGLSCLPACHSCAGLSRALTPQHLLDGLLAHGALLMGSHPTLSSQ